MRERTLDWLYSFSSDNYKENNELKTISKLLEIDEETLHKRSKKSLKFILHNYGMFNISTIDKFNLGLMRSFSQELNILNSFNVEMKPQQIVSKAIEELQSEIGIDENLSEIVISYILKRYDDEDYIDTFKKITVDSMAFLNDTNYQYLKELGVKSREDFKKLKSTISKRIETKKKYFASKSLELLGLISSKGLDLNNFQGKSNGIGKRIEKISSILFKIVESLEVEYFLSSILLITVSESSAY